MTVRLTETAINSAIRRVNETGKMIELIDSATAGLRLRITPRGRRAWVMACRDGWGSLRRFPVGEYPQMGIADARARGAIVRAEVKGGADPIADARRRRQIAKEGRDGIGTLGALLDLYAKLHGEHLRSWPEQIGRIKSVFGKLIDVPLPKITLVDLQLAADGWPARQSAGAAVRYIRPALKWASAPGRAYVPAEMAALRPPASPGRRDRVLSRDELARLLPLLKAGSTPYAACMRFILLTLARRDEAVDARWRDVDLEAGTWIIIQPKNKIPHLIPLSRQARELLAAIKPDDAGPVDYLFPTGTGGRLSNWHKATVAIQRASNTAGWHRHDLRRTGATLLGEMGIMPDIVEAALNHVAIHSALASTYNKSRYRPQVAEALQLLADALDGIENGAAEVVPIRGWA
ncbi:MAG TPA: tyrosine-type recombinase/integrase [Acidiphilium sp.]|jgi:integrase|uniref:tyrosine-type recombinase/integrase n=1 Tax=Acidiphilium sp. C61 TaxID=1671485 RepID=UPI00157AAD2A|nr:site-specific integrase [Acidiphilium sp. C61]HQU11103.1 tyrosine-type recombinase/integrase [Acidiphilium sp.]